MHYANKVIAILSKPLNILLKIHDTIPREDDNEPAQVCVSSLLSRSRAVLINYVRKIYDFDNDFLDNKQVASSYSHVLRTRARVGRPFVDFKIDTTFGSNRQLLRKIKQCTDNAISTRIN